MRKLLKRLLLSLLILHFVSKTVVASEIAELSYNSPQIIERDLSLVTTQDTYAKEQIWYGLPYNSRYILLGYDSVYKHMRTRPQLGFDFTQLDQYESKDIYKAYLSIWNWRPLNTNPYNVKIYPITQSWNERTVDWNNQPSVGEFHNLQMIQPVKGWQYFDVTNMVKHYKDAGETVYGFAIHKELEYEFGAYFCSSNYLASTIIDDGCSSETVPQLVIQLNQQIEAPVIEVIDNGDLTNIIKTINSYDVDINYELSTSLQSGFETSVIQSNSSGNFVVSELLPGKYYYRMRVKYRDFFSDWSNTVSIETFDELIDEFPEIAPPMDDDSAKEDADLTDSITELPDSDLTVEDEENVVTSQVEKNKNGIQIEIVNMTDPVSTELKTNGIVNPYDKVLGVKDTYYHCKIIYNKTTKTAKTSWCTIPEPKIANVANTMQSKGSVVVINYIKPSPINVLYEEVECQLKSIFNPKTWFQCNEVTTFSRGYYQIVNYAGSLYIDSQSKSFRLTTGNDSMLIGKIDSDKKIPKQQAKVTYFTSFSFKPQNRVWIDVNRESISGKVDIPEATIVKTNKTDKPFNLMLDTPVSVTQWHGNTAFQQPHHGIDFAVSERSLYAVGDGTVEAKVWDNYGGECNSGGYTLRIKHDNGMHSVYMHLKNDLDGSLTGLDVGDKVTTGDIIAISSNTGYYNCQPLASHLHFELRKGRLQSTHLDPVAYINADWDEIPTKDYKNNPGRLTGDNPHPGR